MGEEVGDALRSDPSVQKALAIVLLREALPLLGALDEHVAATLVQSAIDTVLGFDAGEQPARPC